MKNDTIPLKRFINPRKGMRLDTFLQSKIKDHSRSFIQFLIKTGNIKVNGKIEKKNYILKGSEEIAVNLIADPATNVKAEKVNFKVIHEEESFLIISKPSGIITHPAGRSSSGTLLQGLLFKYPQLNDWKGLGKPGLVHRLDKETSGLMIVAKTAPAQKIIMKQFADRTVAKHYLAICAGKVSWSQFIDAPIKRNDFNRTSFSVEADGRNAKTYMRPVAGFPGEAPRNPARPGLSRDWLQDKTLLLIKIFTGRTHQIRVHLSHIGYPVLGDIKYGGPDAPRIMLHSYSISFNHPESGRRLYFKTDFPENFSDFLKH
ncbi:RluA family pseudouridine synthase [bacterium]|nr:RluA family pseudouridine synthase [bacterium]MBU3955929.1 RluA family pseudouridine synthase [bacterium]